MSIAIEITDAVFKCQTDEEVFYQRLAQVSGIEKVTSENGKIYVTVATDEQSQAVDDIRAICHIWHASFSICI
ncbi:MAG: hypothetical protein ACPG52_02190 [Cognaticolwellia sp.]